MAYTQSTTDTLRAYLRAVGGGLLIGLPLLFTQEVWWHAAVMPPGKVLVLLTASAVIVTLYTAITGFRAESTLPKVLVDAAEAVGFALLLAVVALTLLGRIGPGTDLEVATSMVALESIPVAFGISLARAQLGGAQADQDVEGPDADASSPRPWSPFQRLLIAAGGALIFALNVAPTDEPVSIGVRASPLLLLGIVAASLMLTAGLVFFADFAGRRHRSAGVLDRPWPETIAAYALSLAVAWTLLWSFGRIDGAGIGAIVGMTVALGVVAARSARP